jgi:hypothetical protein
MAFDVQQMLRKVLDNGWDGIEQAGKQAAEFGARDMAEQQERFEREARIVRAAAATPEGAALLELICRHTFMRSPSAQDYAVRTADEFVITRARREGASSVAFYLLNLASGQPAAAPTEAEGGPT